MGETMEALHLSNTNCETTILSYLVVQCGLLSKTISSITINI